MGDTITRTEVALSVVRLAFCVAVLARFLALGAADDTGRAALVVIPIAVAIALSAAVIVVWRRGRQIPSVAISVLVASDAVIATAVLASNCLWPGDAYLGALSGPDLAVLLAVVAGSGLRLSPARVGLSVALAFAGIAVLVALDATLCPVPVRNAPFEAVMWALLLLATGGAAGLTTWQARRLVWLVAQRSHRLAESREVLAALQGVHHDAHSGVGAMMLTADRLLRALDRGEQARVTEHAVALREQVDLVGGCLHEVIEQATGALIVDRPVETTSVTAAIEDATRVMAVLAPTMRVEDAAQRDTYVRVGGGHVGLVRILVNLLRNAAEGDGRRGAQVARVEMSLGDDTLTLRIEDDGPGLAPKSTGWGAGLAVVSRLAGAAGGTLALAPRETGAMATLTLPRASPGP